MHGTGNAISKLFMSTKTRLKSGLVAALLVSLCSPVIGAPLTNMVDLNGAGRRFVGPDQGNTIRYVVDAEAIPAGHSLPELLTVVSNAFEAWSDTTYIRFQFDGLENFGQTAQQTANAQAESALDAHDTRIMVQLHNLYNGMPDPSLPGVGDHRADATFLGDAGWTTGGRVNGNNFFEMKASWVGLNHTNPALSTLSTVEEVLCHNIGLALGLKTNTKDKTSIMYHKTHADGRGAQLGVLDVNVIQQAYPSNNAVPYTFDRILEIVTTPTNQPPLNIPGINQVELRGYDRESGSLTITFTNEIASALGTFTFADPNLNYAPNGFYDLTAVPGERLFYRYSDGAHDSPYREVKVWTLRPDSFPAGTGDGIPDYFMTDHFGNPDPAAGLNREAGDDNDGDNLTNLEEYIAGMIPTDQTSAQRLAVGPGQVEWQSTADGLYELQTAETIGNWTLVRPLLATNGLSSLPIAPFTNNQTFYRIVKIR